MNKFGLFVAVTIILSGAGGIFLWFQQPIATVFEEGMPTPVTVQQTATPKPTVLPASTPKPSATAAEDDDFAPGLLIFAMLFFIFALIVVGVGVVVATALIGGLAFLTLMGIVSSSVLVGLFQRRPGPALSAFLTQICAAIGAFCGIIVSWLALLITKWPLSFWLVTGLGAFSGLIGGAIVGLPTSLGLRWTYSWVMTRIKARRNQNNADETDRDAP